MALRPPPSPPFDLRRHLSQLIRQVLPIFVLVAAALVIGSAVFDRGTEADSEGKDSRPARVGLLPVERGEGKDALLGFDPALVIPRPLDLVRAPVAARFDFPLGSPLGAMTYDAQPFLTSRHLGDDFNGIGGQDSDRGDPVYAAGDGEVVFSGWGGDGWGNVVTVLHRMPNGDPITTLYGHLERIRLPVGSMVRRGELLGTVGKGDGRYLAHLHFEVRRANSLDPGGGYADAPMDRLSGEAFLTSRRGAPEEMQNEALGGPWDTRFPTAVKSGADRGASLRIKTEATE
ncbi:MAG: M23 family metallopeptidase [Verrucomicrobiae bacterium]|nr:M23 family metallopeptidase [Verrucomicrobiae bacterium]